MPRSTYKSLEKHAWATHTGAKSQFSMIKWPFKVVQGHPFRDEWKGNKGKHNFYVV